MKKLAYLATAVLAGLGLTSTASAEISISGSQTLMYSAAGSVTGIRNYGTVDFGLSTTTASGMTISSGAGITLGDGKEATFTSSDTTAYGFDGLTFATGGVSIEIGTDVGLADGVGEVQDVEASEATIAHSGMSKLSKTVGIADDEGAGISLTTPVGGATLSLAYVADAAGDGASSAQLDDSTVSGMSAKISTSVGAVGFTAAYVTVAGTTDDTETAVAASYDTGMGDVTIAYGASTGDKDGNVVSGAYEMALDADTALAIGYASYNVDDVSGTDTRVSLTRALGGGASVFVDYATISGTTATVAAADHIGSAVSDSENVFAIGTSVSF